MGKAIEVAVGDKVTVEQLGAFTVGANRKGLLLWPDASVKLRVASNRQKIDKGRRISQT